MATRQAAYSKRPAPKQYDPGWLDQELGNLQRAIQPTVIRSLTAAATQQSNDSIVLCNANGAAFTYTLLNPANAGPSPVTIKKTDASANAVTIGGTVDGAASPTLAAQYKSMTIVSDGTSWHKIAAI